MAKITNTRDFENTEEFDRSSTRSRTMTDKIIASGYSYAELAKITDYFRLSPKERGMRRLRDVAPCRCWSGAVRECYVCRMERLRDYYEKLGNS
jgi:hypothetical protein